MCIKMSRYKVTKLCVVLCLVQIADSDSGASSEATGFAGLAFPLSKYNFAR